MGDLVTLLTIFMLAIFVGFEIITKVPPTLHTPLMSGSNATSGIALVGALLGKLVDFFYFEFPVGAIAIAIDLSILLHLLDFFDGHAEFFGGIFCVVEFFRHTDLPVPLM